MDKIQAFAEHLAQNSIGYTRDVPLGEKSTFRIGGPAALFIEPGSQDEVALALAFASREGIPLLVLGAGSNMLFADEGYHGTILHLGESFSQIRREGEILISCQSGAKLSNLCRFAQQQGLAGLEFAYGIPGTVGGALYMNAGAYGGQIEDVAHTAGFMDFGGNLIEFTAPQMGFSYRRSAFMEMDGVLTGATFKLTPAPPEEIRIKMDDYMARRREKQPLEYPSAGSTFKRPPDNYASALIDQCGLKGLRVGGAAVSEKHAGFIVNLGGATCKDVIQLIEQVQRRVKEDTGYKLEREVLLASEL
ncbi:MAG: UDP-N-acetylmuramate dehydrogenase [Oscillospiraceae bacterium]|nr:UDP-N-acetylmuramate dehydrogenase [Oscillospiraceae bacterium]